MGDADFKVEKKVPVPEEGPSRMKRYPLGSMEVGDSFFVPEDEVNNLGSVVQSAHKYGKRHKVFFTTRRVTESGLVGVRVWRVEPPKARKK